MPTCIMAKADADDLKARLGTQSNALLDISQLHELDVAQSLTATAKNNFTALNITGKLTELQGFPPLMCPICCWHAALCRCSPCLESLQVPKTWCELCRPGQPLSTAQRPAA